MGATVKTVLKTREEWLAARHSVGASDVPGLFPDCEYPFSTPYKLWASKTGRLPPIEPTEAMKMGHRLEPLIARMFEEEANCVVGDPGEFTIYRQDDTPFMHATPDRFIMRWGKNELSDLDLDAGEGNLQIKAPGLHYLPEWDEGPPIYTEIQVQAELHSCGKSWGAVAALIGGQDFRWSIIHRNQEFIDGMIEACRDFWALVESDTEPEVGAKDVGVLKILHPESSKVEMRVLPDDPNQEEIMRHVREYDHLSGEAERTESALKYHKAKLMAMMGDVQKLTLPDGSGFSWKSHSVKAEKEPRKEHTVRPFRRQKSR